MTRPDERAVEAAAYCAAFLVAWLEGKREGYGGLGALDEKLLTAAHVLAEYAALPSPPAAAAAGWTEAPPTCACGNPDDDEKWHTENACGLSARGARLRKEREQPPTCGTCGGTRRLLYGHDKHGPDGDTGYPCPSCAPPAEIADPSVPTRGGGPATPGGLPQDSAVGGPGKGGEETPGQTGPGPSKSQYKRLVAQGAIEPGPSAAGEREEFEDWWWREGRLIDPDTSDVPWFDKRKELAMIAYQRGHRDWPEQLASCGRRLHEVLDERDRLASRSAVEPDYEAADREGDRQNADLARQLNARRSGEFTWDFRAIVDAALRGKR